MKRKATVRLAVGDRGLVLGLSQDKGKTWDYVVNCADVMRGYRDSAKWEPYVRGNVPIPAPKSASVQSWEEVPGFENAVHAALHTWKCGKGEKYMRLWGDDVTLRMSDDAHTNAHYVAERLYVREGWKCAEAYLKHEGMKSNQIREELNIFRSNKRLEECV